MLRLARHAAPVLLCLALAQCRGALPPYETVPPALSRAELDAAAGATAPPRVAVCYNAFTTTAAEVRAIAQQSCQAGTVPRPSNRDLSLDNCPLLQPARAIFVCAGP
jgi:hypothetical protein